MPYLTTTAAMRLSGLAAEAGAALRRYLEQLKADRAEAMAVVDPADELPATAGRYIALVALVAGLCVGVFAPGISGDGWQGLVTLTLVAIAFERFGIKIYGETHVSAGVVALFAIAIVYGPAGAAIAGPAVILGATALTATKWHGRLFDASSYTLASVASALLFRALVDVDNVSGWWIPAAAGTICVTYALNSGLVVVLASIYSGEQPRSIWREDHRWIFPYYLVFGFLGVALAAAYEALQVLGVLAFVAPPLMMRFALHQYVTKTEENVLELRHKNSELETANREILEMTRELTRTYDGTLEALVLALDARDRETKGHSLRVMEYVTTIARRLGVDASTTEFTNMQRGALLHDVGKIGVPDFILHKPGPLTPEEWDTMKRHPDIGHGMLRDISFLSGAAAIVHAHHERYDGKGYPNGLVADEIPLGARIFMVADTFDAMTTTRPYRDALSAEMARDEIVRHSGTQFDPHVVQAFLAVYDELVRKSIEDRYEDDEVAQAA